MSNSRRFLTLRSAGTVAAFVALVAIASHLVTFGLHAYAHASGPTGSFVSKALQERNERESLEEAVRNREFYRPLKIELDLPGIQNADLHDISEVDLPNSTEVIGVELNGHACAFVLSEMTEKHRHVVNVTVESTPISATYCNLSECVRVLTWDTQSTIPLGIGGLDIDSQLVLLLDGQRYGHTSEKLPLEDVPFRRIDLGTWKLQHPGTQIYNGATASDS